MTDKKGSETLVEALAAPPFTASPPREAASNGNSTPPAADSFDPFDPASLRISTVTDVAVERVMTAVPVRKPGRNEFFRVRDDAGFTVDTYIVERGEGLDREVYIANPDMRDFVVEELRLVRLFTCISRKGTVFLWPCKLPRDDTSVGRRWAETALMVADRARSCWVRMVGDRDLGGYSLRVAVGDLGDPQWPDKTFRQLLEIAFRGKVIDRPDHEVIRELNGDL